MRTLYESAPAMAWKVLNILEKDECIMPLDGREMSDLAEVLTIVLREWSAGSEQ